MIPATKRKLKPVTLYLSDVLYGKYQLQAARRGCKTAELVRSAMEAYAEINFGAKKPLEAVSFARTVRLKRGASDFLGDPSWKDEVLSSGVRL